MEDKKNGKEKKEWTVKRVLTTIIIGVLALLMVGGSFYYIFSPGFRKGANAFGFYDGEPIVYENNNVFSRTLLADDTYVQAATTGDYNAIYQSWYKAYQSQVVAIALTKMAKQAGVIAPQEVVNKAILESGIFNNEDGEFDKNIYDETSDSDKRMYYTYMESSYPYQVVLNDIFTALTSAQESAFITDYASDARTINYFVVGSNAYPDDLTKNYAQENKDYFKWVDISMISCTTQEDAQNCYNELKAGTSWSDAVAKYSLDAYASNDGYVGFPMFAGIFTSTMNDQEAYKVLNQLKAGEYSAPIEGPYGWSLYKANEDAKDADFEDVNVMLQAKEAIYQKEPEKVQNYIDQAVANASEAVKKDFDEAAKLYSPGMLTVGPVSNDVAGSNVIYGIKDMDVSGGLLANAVDSDENLGKSMFKDSVGSVVGPIDVDGNYLFAKIASATKEEGLGQLTETMYSYYRTQFDILDFQNSMITSPKHEDNFIAKFFELVLGQSINQ